MNTSQWICEDCWYRLTTATGKEYECFTDANWLETLCHYCNERTGKYHVVNPPIKIPEPKTGPSEFKYQPDPEHPVNKLPYRDE